MSGLTRLVVQEICASGRTQFPLVLFFIACSFLLLCEPFVKMRMNYVQISAGPCSPHHILIRENKTKPKILCFVCMSGLTRLVVQEICASGRTQFPLVLFFIACSFLLLCEPFLR